MSIVVFLLLSAFAHAAEPDAADPRHATPEELHTLANNAGLKLTDCPAIKTGGPIEIAFLNRTSEHVDKEPLVKALSSTLKPSSRSKTKKTAVTATLESTESTKGEEFETSYVLKVKATQGKAACDWSETLVKKGTLKPK